MFPFLRKKFDEPEDLAFTVLLHVWLTTELDAELAIVGHPEAQREIRMELFAARYFVANYVLGSSLDLKPSQRAVATAAYHTQHRALRGFDEHDPALSSSEEPIRVKASKYVTNAIRSVAKLTPTAPATIDRVRQFVPTPKQMDYRWEAYIDCFQRHLPDISMTIRELARAAAGLCGLGPNRDLEAIFEMKLGDQLGFATDAVNAARLR